MLLQRKRKQARGVLLRIVQIGAAVGLTVGVVAFAARTAVPAIFTQDVLVSTEVQRVLPMVALFMVSHLIGCHQCPFPHLSFQPQLSQVYKSVTNSLGGLYGPCLAGLQCTLNPSSCFVTVHVLTVTALWSLVSPLVLSYAWSDEAFKRFSLRALHQHGVCRCGMHQCYLWVLVHMTLCLLA